MTTPQRHGGLADVLDDHLAAEFATRDLDATMATMTDDPYLNTLGQDPEVRPAGALPRPGARRRDPGRRFRHRRRGPTGLMITGAVMAGAGRFPWRRWRPA